MRRIVWGSGLFIVAGLAAVAFLGQALPVQMTAVERLTVVEYVAEDAKTRLAGEYIIDMPLSGTLDRIKLEVGDWVEEGQIVASIDAYPLEQRKKEILSFMAQAKAHVTGVDVAKPKSEDIESAAIHVREMRDAREIARKTRAVTEFNFEESEKAFRRAESLVKDGAVSESFFDEAEVRFKGLEEGRKRAALEEEAAEKALEMAILADRRLAGSIDDNEYMRDAYLAEIDGLEAQLATLETDLKKTQIRSPVSGPVLEKYIEDKRVLAAGTPLVMVGDLDSIEIECDVLSEEVGQIRVGDRVEITGKALRRRTVEGTVKRIYPSGFMKISALGVEQQRVRTLIGFDNSDARLLPGTSVDLKIIIDESIGALAVPDRATFRREGEWSVFAVVAGNAELRTIKIGLRNDDWAEILEGLEEGDTIVGERKNELEDGARVTPL